VNSLHPFYTGVLEIAAGGSLDRVKICLSVSLRASTLSMNILDQYARKISTSEDKESNRLMRQAFGRASSILRKNKECINWIIDLSLSLKKAKSIDPDLPTVVIAGPPNVGKSTLISKLSSAKPEIASYPFTTKEIHVGHTEVNGYKVQFIDTPGILDRPSHERNWIEKKAINALKNLKNVTVFLLDGSSQSLYTVKEQIDLLQEVLSLGNKTIVTINKIDEKGDIMKELEEILMEKGLKYLKISAERGEGLEDLKREIFKDIEPLLSRGV
ncbi:GTPase, partial [Acidianus sp. RZ1]|uniref:NOG1 family protein n=1 Tax=Acidianus sp. RZ1 TaxID=1540082 RepID=UPI001491D7C2